MILPPKLPAPFQKLLDTISWLLDARHSELLPPLFLGVLFGHGRRTATAWFRAGGIAEHFRRAYTLLGTIGRDKTDLFAGILFGQLRPCIVPPKHWLFAIDDTPTKRFGPCVEGAGRHHNPTPGPTHQRFLYGHIWVTVACVVRHPQRHTVALPLLADLYIRAKDVDTIDADRRPIFATKLEMAARQIHWTAQHLQGTDRPIWFAVDGFYAKRPVFKAARADGVVLVGRLRWDAALRDLPPVVEPDQRGQGRPRIYGYNPISLEECARRLEGWQTVECFQYQEQVSKTVQTFLATWRPAGGVIRVVVVQEEQKCLAYLCTDPNATVADILEAVAGRTAIEDTFKDVKEVEGAGQQQLRYWRANVGAYHVCLWGYTTVEWWSWDKSAERLCDRSDSPWDEVDRRPSHANKRHALHQEVLAEEFWRRWGEQPCPPEIRELLQEVLAQAG